MDTPHRRPSLPATPESFRRSFTAPNPRLSPSPRPSHVDPGDAKAEILYSHPTTETYSFSPPGVDPRTTKPASIDLDYPVDAIETLPWTAPRETLDARGKLVFEKVPGSTTFLKTGKVLAPILRNSQCWCVDGDSKFVLRKGPFRYYRIELPNATEEDKQKIEELKSAIAKILRFEVTPCPFKRDFKVELPADVSTPKKKRAWKPRHSIGVTSPLNMSSYEDWRESRRPSTAMSMRSTTTDADSIDESRSVSRADSYSTEHDTPDEDLRDIEEDKSEGSGSDVHPCKPEAHLFPEDQRLTSRETSSDVDPLESSPEPTTSGRMSPVLEATSSSSVDVSDNSGASAEARLDEEIDPKRVDGDASSIDRMGDAQREALFNRNDDSLTDFGEASTTAGTLSSGQIATTPDPIKSDDVVENIATPFPDEEANTAIAGPTKADSDIVADHAPVQLGPVVVETSTGWAPSGENDGQIEPQVAQKDVSGQEIEMAHSQEPRDSLDGVVRQQLDPASEEFETKDETVLVHSSEDSQVLMVDSTDNEGEPALVDESEVDCRSSEQPVSNTADEGQPRSESSPTTGLKSSASVDSFHSIASFQTSGPTSSLSPSLIESRAPEQGPSPVDPEQVENERSAHRRGVSEVTVVDARTDRESVSEPSEQPSTPTLVRDSASEGDWPDVITPAPVEGVRQRRTGKRSGFSPLPPASTLLTSSSRGQDNHLATAIVQKAVTLAVGKPLEAVILLFHVFSRIAGGATVQDLMSGELFRRPDGQSGQQARHRRDGSWVEDDYGVPIRGRQRTRESVVADDEDSWHDLD